MQAIENVLSFLLDQPKEYKNMDDSNETNTETNAFADYAVRSTSIRQFKLSRDAIAILDGIRRNTVISNSEIVEHLLMKSAKDVFRNDG